MEHKETMKLKEWMDGVYKEGITIKKLQHTATLIQKMLELESIDKWLNVMYGIELEINVKPVEQKEGRFYGMSVVEELKKGS